MCARRARAVLWAVAVAALWQHAGAQRGPSAFPWCRCDATLFDTPFRVANITLSETAATRDYTFTMGTSGCLISSPCCGMDMSKLAFHARDGCDASSVAKVVVTTIRVDYKIVVREHSVQFRSYGPGRLMYKVTNLRWLYEDVLGSNITVSLVKGSKCDTLGKLLEEKTASTLDKATKCCPTMTLPAF